MTEGAPSQSREWPQPGSSENGVAPPTVSQSREWPQSGTNEDEVAPPIVGQSREWPHLGSSENRVAPPTVAFIRYHSRTYESDRPQHQITADACYEKEVYLLLAKNIYG